MACSLPFRHDALHEQGRRHAPTPSAFCTQPTPAAPPVVSRLQVGRVNIQLLQAALSSTTTTLAPAPQGASFMLRGFSWGLVGSLTCLCAEATSSGDCRLSMTNVCAQPPPCLQQTCASGGLTRNLPMLFGPSVASLRARDSPPCFTMHKQACTPSRAPPWPLCTPACTPTAPA